MKLSTSKRPASKRTARHLAAGGFALASCFGLFDSAALANSGHGNFGGRAGGYSGGSGAAYSGGGHNGGGYGGRGGAPAPAAAPRVIYGGHQGPPSYGYRVAQAPQIIAPAVVARPAPVYSAPAVRAIPAPVYAPTYSGSQYHRAPAVISAPAYGYATPSYGYAKPYYGGSRWQYSSGFRPHHHRYPSIGYAVPALAASAIALSYAGARLYFDSGIWYRPANYGGYVVAAPPYGAVIPSLPYDYASITYGGVPYYYGNGVYYTEVPGQGYAVTPAPSGLPPVAGNGYEPIPGANGSSGAGSLALAQLPDVQIAPRAEQSSAQLFSDRADCSRWAAGQSGFDPARGRPADSQGWESAKTYREAEVSCLQARGYDAR